MNCEFCTHNIPPVFSPESSTLILGSFPSLASRDADFYYAHPQNRFWRVMASLLCSAVPNSVDEKKHMLLAADFALWDVIKNCTVTGSSDSSIKDIVPNDIASLVNQTRINRIFTNGALSYNLYRKYIEPTVAIQAVKLPSTSPANAAYSLEKLIAVWHSSIFTKE